MDDININEEFEDDDPILECDECGELLEFDPDESSLQDRRIYVCMACSLMHTSDGKPLMVEDDDGGNA